MFVIHIILGVGWTLFWGYWIYKAVGVKDAVSSRAQSMVTIRLIIFALVLIALQFGHHNFGKGQSEIVLGLIGLALFMVGLLLALWARLYLGRNWGFPMSRKVDAQLITSGPYHYIRHPIYTGILTAMLGTALATNLLWFFVFLAFGAYFIYSAFEEEKDMAKQFPKAYLAYKQNSKMLIPFVF